VFCEVFWGIKKEEEEMGRGRGRSSIRL